jgi:hypothetical protein
MWLYISNCKRKLSQQLILPVLLPLFAPTNLHIGTRNVRIGSMNIIHPAQVQEEKVDALKLIDKSQKLNQIGPF